MPDRRDALVAGLLLLAGAAVFANGLAGDFVYDDRPQILDNHFVRYPGRWSAGLLADVWAFKGERDEAWSNYWRPGFLAWLALNRRLFGVESAVGWHAASLALHLAACALAYVVLRRLALSRARSGLVAGVFAVHPSHVESVAWVSGAPDLLVAVGLLAALALELGPPGRGFAVRRAAALAAYAFALASKEVAVLVAPLVPLALWARDPEAGAVRRHAWRALPYGLLALAYLIARHAVLGRVQIEVPWKLSATALALTLPAVLWFYVRQAFLPLRLAPGYPLRAVTPATADWASCFAPAAALVLVAALAVIAARRRRASAFGLAFFALLLAPALNLNAFIQEQLVHDRYLYLPLLGAWLVPVAAWPATRLAHAAAPRRRRVVLAALLAGGIGALSALTVRYNPVWASDLALWRHAVAADPGSAFGWAEYGGALARAGRGAEAAAALDRALALRPVRAALLTRAELAVARGELAAAEADLRRVLAAAPADVAARERLAIVLQRSGRLGEAEAVLRQGLELAPFRACSLGSNLGVVLVLQGRRDEALRELAAAAARAEREPNPACTAAVFRLGVLHAEAGRAEEARRAFADYLRITDPAPDRASAAYRAQARQALAAPRPEG